MAVTPYKHQVECVQKLGKTTLPARLIADEMGLGKTLEALLIDGELRSERHWATGQFSGLPMPKNTMPPYKRPTLIVAPLATHRDAWVKAIRSLPDLVNWDEESFARNIEVIDPKDRAKLAARLKQKDLPCYVIVHYEALRLMAEELGKVKWFHIIADEVHRVKNRKAQQTHYLKTLQAYYKTGCSGTPADDKPQDIWSVLNWLYPKQFSSYWRFINTYCEQQTQEVRGQGRTFKKIVGVNKERIPELHAQIDPWYMRRKKEEVLDSLPPKYYTELHVDLGPSQRRAYDQMAKDMIAWIGEHQDVPLASPVVVAQLTRLQQFALSSLTIDPYTRKVKLIDPSAKLDRFEELVEGNPDESLVVFSQSRSMCNLAAARMDKMGVSNTLYHGQIPHAQREQAVEDFQADRKQVFIATIAAGGEGITLTRSSTVVFFDRMWNPTKNFQAEDRLHRIGQMNAVQVIDIMARDTVDQGRKQRIANKWEDLLWLLGDKK
jgi:SNF2 family DNA or RNA helicase